MTGWAAMPCEARNAAELLPDAFTQALARAGVPHDAVSVVVQGLPARPVRLSHRAHASMNPASVMKLVTTYAALDTLGSDYTWKNRVYVDGAIRDGVLFGNLILRGSGDPKLVHERIDQLFKAIQTNGVREVRGDILLDRDIFNIPRTNPADFDGEPLRPYNATPDGLLINFKSLIFTFTPDTHHQRVHIKSEPPIWGVQLPTEVRMGLGSCRDWRSLLRANFTDPERIRFAGQYPASCGERIWSVAYMDPPSYAARVIKAMWLASGGTLTGHIREDRLTPSARLLHIGPSLPLAEIAADINKFSNNLMAQQLFLTLSARPYATDSAPASSPPHGSFEASRQAIATWWQQRLPAQTPPVLDNGSGLSRKERITADALNALLQAAAASPHAHTFANSLAIAGMDGTAASMRERNAHSPVIGAAQVKTGSLRDVTAIAGYVSAASGQRYSMAAIINHPNANTDAARVALDRLLEWIVQDQ